MLNLPTIQGLVYKKPLQLYLASSQSVIGALMAQEDREGIEQLVYYISRAPRDAETRYPMVETICLSIFYASQRLCHYILAYEVHLKMKSHAIKVLLQKPILSGRISQWLL